MTITQREDRSPWPWWQTLAVCAAGVLVLTIACCVLLEPRWETNDDIAMSMIAHGYGVGAHGSPNLIFSNVLWGHIVRALPNFGDVLGYSLASISLLVICATSVAYGLARHGSGAVIACAGLLLIFARPLLFQQFTINAGLLTVAAVLCWRLYALRGARLALAIGCVLFFTSWLVRRPEAQLVLLLALPLLPWHLLRKDRAAQGALLVLVLALMVVGQFDRHAYDGAEWQAFKALNPVRAAYTDFGAGRQAEVQAELIAKHGLSKNDIRLVSRWFFVDPRIADPVKLDAILRELPPPPADQGPMQSAMKGLAAIWNINLLPLLLAALLLTVLRPSWPLLLSWCVYLAAAFITGWMGRPGVLRVLVPLISLLAIAPLLVTPGSGWRRKAMTVVVIGAALGNVWQVLTESRAMYHTAQRVRKDLDTLSGHTFIAWGAGLPYEHLYPVVHTPAALRDLRLYGLGVFTLAPHSVAAEEERRGTGFIQRLLSAEGVPLISAKGVLPMLEVYCAEHHAGQLREVVAAKYGVLVVGRQRCEVVATQP